MILGLDTATEWLNLAIVNQVGAWTKRVLTDKTNSASCVLLPAIDELLLEANASRKDIKGAVACIGPGGFTGLRVGVAAAEGLAVVGLDVWGFSAFELRARTLGIAHKGTACAQNVNIVLDGQRREAFLQEWDIFAPKPLGPATKIPLAQLHNQVKQGHWWTPDRFRPLAEEYIGHPPMATDEGASTLMALTELCRVCPNRPPENPLAPFYLRETDAEINFPDAAGHLREEHRKGIAR